MTWLLLIIFLILIAVVIKYRLFPRISFGGGIDVEAIISELSKVHEKLGPEVQETIILDLDSGKYSKYGGDESWTVAGSNAAATLGVTVEANPIAKGSYGSVYKAKDASGRTYALKYQKYAPAQKSLIDNEVLAYRRIQESHCPGFNQLHAAVVQPDAAYYLLEFIDGVSVQKWVAHIEAEAGGVPYVNIVSKYLPSEREFISTMVSPLLDSIKCMHRHKMTHRDIKPDNIMLSSAGNMQPVIIDAGTVCFESSCKTVSVSGFAAPEMVSALARILPDRKIPAYASKIYSADLRNGDYTYAADIWAVGAVLYYMLTGEFIQETIWRSAPYHRKGVSDISIALTLLRASLSRWTQVRAIIAACLLESPTERRKIFNSMEYIDGKYVVRTVRRGLIWDAVENVPLEDKLSGVLL